MSSMEPTDNGYITTDRQRVRLDVLNVAHAIHSTVGDTDPDKVLSTAIKLAEFVEAVSV